MTDHNEAMRLAEILEGGSHQFNDEAAALLRQQAERIAELEARVHTCGPTCSKAGCINRRLTTERDQLRAEVESKTRALRIIHTWAGVPGALKPDQTRQLCGKELGIDRARTTHKDEG